MLGAPRNRRSAFTQLPMKTGHLVENEDESGMRLCACWGKIFEARAEGERHRCHETILRYVQKAPDDIQWEIDRHAFDEMMATKKESSPGPDGIPMQYLQVCGRIGFSVLV